MNQEVMRFSNESYKHIQIQAAQCLLCCSFLSYLLLCFLLCMPNTKQKSSLLTCTEQFWAISLIILGPIKIKTLKPTDWLSITLIM